MLGMLEGIEEYNNQGALLGIDGTEGEELLGALRRMNPIQRQRTINKLSNTGTGSRGSGQRWKNILLNCLPISKRHW